MTRLAAIAVIVACAACGCGGAKTSPTTTVTAIGQAPAAHAASRAELIRLSTKLGHPVYWAGGKAGDTYELTHTSDGRIYVRYLPPGVLVGARPPLYTIVGTYPVANAPAVLRKLSKRSGEASFAAPHGGFAVFNRAHRTNIYLAYPGSNLQIEVFDPSPNRARHLVASGRIVPVG
ncbi:MAG: hypothetical protein WBB76_06575 [Gaiellaceae bacterium]